MNQGFEYTVGGSLPITASSYVIRQADLELDAGLRAGELCAVLSSRQSGKTSLLVRTLYRLQADGIACAVIDLSAISQSASVEQWYASVVHKLVTDLPLKPAFDLLSWWKAQAGLTPGNRLRQFMRMVLLEQITQPIVIFLDEIENTLRLDFQAEFFNILYSCYEQRRINPAYSRLTYMIAGVSTIFDLLSVQSAKPWYPIRLIELSPFQLHELQPLTRGLIDWVQQPQVMLDKILQWTGGQPFLTQKLCHLIQTKQQFVPAGEEANILNQIVYTCVIDRWETQDEPQHLRTIRDRLLNHPLAARHWLKLYQQLLQGVPITLTVEDSASFLLTGLVKRQQNQWGVYNPIYEKVFTQPWVIETLKTL